MSNRSAVETLLKYGADPNARDLDGKTPLDYALEIGDRQTAEVLLKAGARSAVA
jgi:ankyrin repeat protein